LSEEVCQLVNRCLAGDESAMVEYVDRFRGQVYGLCYRMLGQRQDAEDMAQETFIRALRSLRHFDQQRDMEPWLLAIAGNRCRSLLATRGKRQAARPLLEELPDDSPNVQAAYHLAEEVDLALMQIREEHRQAFILFHEQELSYAEIARAMKCPLGTVKTWIHRARSELTGWLVDRGVVEESRHAVRTV